MSPHSVNIILCCFSKSYFRLLWVAAWPEDRKVYLQLSLAVKQPRKVHFAVMKSVVNAIFFLASWLCILHTTRKVKIYFIAVRNSATDK